MANDDDRPGMWEDEPFRARSKDRVSLTLAMLTLALVAGAAWLRFGSGLFGTAVQLGEPFPPTRLAELDGTGSRLLLGVQGEVLWIVFVPTNSAEAPPVLADLESAYKGLRRDGRFRMFVAAVDPGKPERARAAWGAFKGRLPLYLAGDDVSRSFGIESKGDPWHFLVDPHGRLAAVARGSGKDTIDRLARMATEWLDALAPESGVRFRLTLADGG